MGRNQSIHSKHTDTVRTYNVLKDRPWFTSVQVYRTTSVSTLDAGSPSCLRPCTSCVSKFVSSHPVFAQMFWFHSHHRVGHSPGPFVMFSESSLLFPAHSVVFPATPLSVNLNLLHTEGLLQVFSHIWIFICFLKTSTQGWPRPSQAKSFSYPDAHRLLVLW